MESGNYLTTGQLAKLANVSLRTVRYYDQEGLLKPETVQDNGNRLYSPQSLASLQQILLLKSLGFSLKEIGSLVLQSQDQSLLQDSLMTQHHLIQEKIKQYQLIAHWLEVTSEQVGLGKGVDWVQLLGAMQEANSQQLLVSNYQNAANLNSRIRIHEMFSHNPHNWYDWLFHHLDLQEGAKILELGAGDGSMWKEKHSLLPQSVSISLTDSSQGMLRDAQKKIGPDPRFSYQLLDINHWDWQESDYDLIIANHCLFYAQDIEEVLNKIAGSLKANGLFMASTYGKNHMLAVTQLVQKFNHQIQLSSDHLAEKFGKENGQALLSPYFSQIDWLDYPDYLVVDQADPLIRYILSCHGNQHQYIASAYQEFRQFIEKHTKDGYKIQKDAGVFICRM